MPKDPKSTHPKSTNPKSADPDEPASLFDAVQRAWPEASGHLLRAGTELMLGFRKLVEGIGEVVGPHDESGERASSRIKPVPIRRPGPKRDKGAGD